MAKVNYTKIDYTKMFNAIDQAIKSTSCLNHCTSSTPIHFLIEQIYEDEPVLHNGYKIRFNPVFNKWQTSHNEIGTTEEFNTLRESINYCDKG